MAIDYDSYRMKPGERALVICGAQAFIAFLTCVFYHSLFVSLVFFPLAFLYPSIRTKQIIVRRKEDLLLQFRDALYSLSSSLAAGRSMESALREVLKDLSLIYPEPDTCILQEFREIIRKTEMNMTIEEALYNFARRSRLEDIKSFADVFALANRGGGNLITVMQKTSAIISEKLRIADEINTMLAERRFEQKVLNIMPVAMIVLLSFSVGEYMRPVFETVFGRIIMTIALALLGLAYYISKKLMEIEV